VETSHQVVFIVVGSSVDTVQLEVCFLLPLTSLSDDRDENVVNFMIEQSGYLDVLAVTLRAEPLAFYMSLPRAQLHNMHDTRIIQMFTKNIESRRQEKTLSLTANVGPNEGQFTYVDCCTVTSKGVAYELLSSSNYAG